MNKEEFKNEISKIQIAYNKVFSSEEKKIWYEEFKIIDQKEFSRAISETIQEVKFVPKIADIRSRIKVNSNERFINDPYRNLYKNLEWMKFVN